MFNSFQQRLANFSQLRLLVVLAGLLILAGISVFLVVLPQRGGLPGDGDGGDAGVIVTPTPSDMERELLPSDATVTLVYGTFSADKAVIYAINDDGINNIPIAAIPVDSKYVRLVAEGGGVPDLLYYIGETDEFDRGKKLVQHRISTQAVGGVAEADADWFIDDYRVSPDGSWIAWWEIKPDPGHEREHTLFASRVFVAPVADPSSKRLVVNEHSTGTFIHLPRFFDGGNNLYLDRFKPSEYAFYLGLYKYIPTSGSIVPVAGMEKDSYNSNPVVSPDGGRIAFTVFNSNATVKLTPGTTESTRETAINRNMIVVLELNSGIRTAALDPVASNPASPTQYGKLSWSGDGEELAFEQFKLERNTSGEYKPVSQGLYKVRLADGIVQQVVENHGGTRDFGVIGFSFEDEVDQRSLLYYTKTDRKGSLGPEITLIPQLYFATSVASGGERELPILPLGMMQYIGFTQKPRGNPLGVGVPDSDILRPGDDALSLQLGSFDFRPVVRPGSNPRSDCENQWEEVGYPSFEACEMCPVYFYPEEETAVNVRVGDTPVFNSNIEYSNGWNIIANPGGTIREQRGNQSKQEELYQSLKFDYSSPLPPAPDYGWVVSEKEAVEQLVEYAQRLGLNERELAELSEFWQKSLPYSPFYHISHFTEENAKKVLPLKFNPEPDTFINIVFYVRALAAPISVAEPEIAPVHRDGFTIVSWSAAFVR